MNRVQEKTVHCFSKLTNELKSKVLSLCKDGRLQVALKTILDFEEPTTILDSSLYTPILQLCIDKKAEKEGRFIHHHLMRNGYLSDLYLSTKLIIFYSKVGDVKIAREVFDEMSERSIVSWTAMLSGYCQNGYYKEGLKVFSAMHRLTIKPNQFTYGSVLKACTNLMCLESGKQVQCCIVKSSFFENIFVQSALVDLHSKCGRMEDARYLFEHMLQRDVVCWNALIGGYTVHGLADDSFAMFVLMLSEGFLPDQFSIGSVLRASGYCRSLTRVHQTHGFVVHLGFESHRVVSGSLIDAYAKCGDLKSARHLYDLMHEKDLISCTALLTGYAREGRSTNDALDVFSELYQMNRGMDAVALCSMLNICANTASLSLGGQFHALAVKSLAHFDVAMGNALIDMYAKSGEIEDAYRAFDEMKEKNVVSWTSLIAGYGKHGYGEKAVSLFEKMKDNGLNPNDVTFLSVLFACSHTGMINKGSELFSSMITGYNISPRAEHYSCLIDLFARGGEFKQAYNLLCMMNHEPNASLWGAILGACRTHGSLSIGKEAARHLFDMQPEKSVNYTVLASIYSASGLWEEASRIRKLMVRRNMIKDPGCSLIQYNSERSLALEIN